MASFEGKVVSLLQDNNRHNTIMNNYLHTHLLAFMRLSIF